MHFLINELSFIAQASTKYEADALMAMLVSIIAELEPIQGDDPIQVHSSFANRNISVDSSIKQWVYEKLKSSNDRNIGSLFVRIMSQGPFIDKTLNESLSYHECKFNERDVSESSLAGAAYLKGALISLKNAPEFTGDCVQVTFTTDGEFYENVEISNLTDVSQANKLRPRYVPTRKHDASRGGWGTLMDLGDEVAQAVLDKGVVNGRQIYGYFEGKFYEFQSDNVGGFHGYPVALNEVPPKVIKKMQGLGFC
jgi:hypothetical protein